MQTYILIDLNNLFFRAKHVANKGSLDMKVGMSLLISFNSIVKMWKKFNGSHVIFCLDAKSWRREIYPQYKLGRRIATLKKSPREQEEDELFKEAFDDMIKFLTERSNCTVLREPRFEADDLITCWVRFHPEDRHIIISSDSDFYQLLNDNVEVYNGITNYRVTKHGVFDDKDQNLEFILTNDSKLRIKTINKHFVPDEDWIEWALFSKIMRGDAGDGIFSAYPKVRQTKLRTAFLDRENQGYNWNNLMMQEWTDHENKKWRVLDAYNLNKKLIDLSCLPDDIETRAKEIFNSLDKSILNASVNMHFLKFCNRHDLQSLIKYPDNYLSFLTKKLEKQDIK